MRKIESSSSQDVELPRERQVTIQTIINPATASKTDASAAQNREIAATAA